MEPERRTRRGGDYRHWERSASVELWQLDVVGGVPLLDLATGELTEAKIVGGIDDHSRFVVCARAEARATARPVRDALEWAIATYGCPHEILTDIQAVSA
jgi:hypothetical protein